MQHSLEILRGAQGVVLDPSLRGAFVLFFLSFVNELSAFFPFAILVASQLLFMKGGLTFLFVTKLLFLVSLPIGLGSALGSLPLFAAAYWGGKPAIKKFQKRLHFSWEDVERATGRFQGKPSDEVIFFLVRCLPVLPSFPVDVGAGIVRMDPVTYFVLTAAGFGVRMFVTLLAFGLGMDQLLRLRFLHYTR